MKIAVIGVGHVGLVTAAALVQWGHTVVGIDSDAGKVEQLRRGDMPFYEPNLAELVREGLTTGRLSFAPDVADGLAGAQVAFICVGTPPLPGGGPNLAYVEEVGRVIVEHVDGDILVVEKSTVPANTGERLTRLVQREAVRTGNGHRIEVASNPEFLREGNAVEDTLHPDRIVYGTSSEWARGVLREVYATVVAEDGCPVVECDVSTAELIKHASNAFLASRISFINTVAAICDAVGADVGLVAEGMGHDKRIGPHFLQAGLGYGGSCFPKDVDAFIHLAQQVGVPFRILEAVREVNDQQRGRVLAKLEQELWNLPGKTITLLGLAFKPGTDDLRESPALHLARELVERGATVRGYDPVAADAVRREGHAIELFDDPIVACQGAHAAILCTEWDEVVKLDPGVLRQALAYPVVIDGRNAWDGHAMIDAGLRYRSIGGLDASR